MFKHKHIVNIYTREIDNKSHYKMEKFYVFFCFLLGSVIITKERRYFRIRKL